MPRDPRERSFFDDVPPAGKLLFFAAIFFVFAPLLIVQFQLREPTLTQALCMSVVSGGIAASWAATFVVNRWFLASAIALHALAIAGFAGWLPAWSWGRITGVGPVGFVATFQIAAGYMLFLAFINTEGKRSVRIRTELALASDIHRTLVPALDTHAGPFHIVGASAASTEVGGDLIDLVRGEGSTHVWVADVSGHGVRAGVVMAMLKATLRFAGQDGSLAARIATANTMLLELTDVGTFATLAALELSDNGTVSAALAGHLPVLLLRGGRVRRIDNNALPLGIVADHTIQTQPVQCQPGDTLAVLTDGLVEVADRSGRQLGLDQIERTLAEGEHEPRAIFDRVMRRARAHGRVADDCTLLVVKREK